MRRVEFLGCRFDACTMRDAVATIDEAVSRGRFLQHSVVNVAKLVHMRDDPELKEAVEACGMINADGMGIVWGARFVGLDVPERVTGIDLFYQLVELSARRGYGIYLLGATDDVVRETCRILGDKYPGLLISGFHHGYFWGDEERVVRDIRSSGARLLFVAISSPLKEKFINRWQRELGVSFAMGVGGTFDVVAGKVSRAPAWMRRFGLEWLFRLIQEPRRLWRRYLITNFRFGLMLLRERFGSGAA